jgi:uncharacterized protein YecE (DUF72 family)
VIRIGTSGWQYADWRGRFYPTDLPQRQWLPFFASRFSTTELNNSFYRLPEASNFARWRDATPEGFVMAVKASRFITHLKRLRDPEEPVALLWSRAVELGPRLGPVLFQLPPRFPAEPERLARLLACLPERMRAAVEFRDPSWHTAEIHRMLHDSGVALVWPDRPGARAELPALGGWAYIRFHQGRPTAAGYTRRTLERWADRIAGLDVDEVWVYFNNDPGAAAIRDAETLTSLLAARGAIAA